MLSRCVHCIIHPYNSAYVQAKGAITDALKDMFGVDDLEDSLNDLKDGLLSGDFDKVRGAVEGVVEFVESVFSGDAFGDGMSLEDFEVGRSYLTLYL